MINAFTSGLNHPIWIILTVLGIIGIISCVVIIAMMKRQNDANNETLSKRWSDINKLTNENKLLQEKNEKIEEELINERNQTMMAREQLSTALQNNLNAEENYANQENDTNNNDNIPTATTPVETQTEQPVVSTPVIQPQPQDVFEPLKNKYSKEQIWVIRKLFKSLSDNCPKGQLPLIEDLKKMAIKDLL